MSPTIIQFLQGVRTTDDGRTIVLELVDASEALVKVLLPFDVAEELIAMIEAALFIAARRRTIGPDEIRSRET